MAEEQGKTPNPANIQAFRRDPDFVSRYANNVQIESSAFDAKMVFGILDQSSIAKGGSLAVDQHTAISLSWIEVKLLIFFLQLHVAGHEKENGKIKIPANAIPPEPPATPQPQFDNPKGREGLEFIRKMRADFIASLKD